VAPGALALFRGGSSLTREEPYAVGTFSPYALVARFGRWRGNLPCIGTIKPGSLIVCGETGKTRAVDVFFLS
jgi:hypothetical protein